MRAPDCVFPETCSAHYIFVCISTVSTFFIKNQKYMSNFLCITTKERPQKDYSKYILITYYRGILFTYYRGISFTYYRGILFTNYRGILFTNYRSILFTCPIVVVY